MKTMLAYLGFILLLRTGQAQQGTTNNSITSNDGNFVTVTSISTVAIVVVPQASPSIPDSSFSNTTSTISNTSLPSSQILLPTVAYTGQAILVGPCNIPLFTRLALEHGSYIDVPLVGCSDDRPECCPSLSPPKPDMAAITSTSSVSTTESHEPTPTGVVSLLSASPLSICPHDFVDIDPVCCPSGYNLYNQAIIGNITPCYSHLSTAMPIPSSVSNSIISEAEVTASAVATVSIVVNQVYALGLPCADREGVKTQEHISGLSTGAITGIAVGVGVTVLLLICMFLLVAIRLHQRRHEPKISTTGALLPSDPMSPQTSMMETTIGTDSQYSGQLSPQFQPFVMPCRSQPNDSYGAMERVGSWMSQASTVTPTYPQVPVEMRAPQGHEIYEIDNPEKMPDIGYSEMPNGGQNAEHGTSL